MTFNENNLMFELPKQSNTVQKPSKRVIKLRQSPGIKSTLTKAKPLKGKRLISEFNGSVSNDSDYMAMTMDKDTKQMNSFDQSEYTETGSQITKTNNTKKIKLRNLGRGMSPLKGGPKFSSDKEHPR